MTSKLLHLFREPEPRKEPSRALVAAVGGDGLVLDYAGPDITYEVSECGRSLGDLGLVVPPKSVPPDGLSIWEGRYRYDEGFASPDHPPEPSVDAIGEYRVLTEEEVLRYHREGRLWTPPEPPVSPDSLPPPPLTGTEDA